MSDGKTQTGGQDRSCISLSEDYDVRDWAEKFDVTFDELKAGVLAIVNKASARAEWCSRLRLAILIPLLTFEKLHVPRLLVAHFSLDCGALSEALQRKL